MSQKIEIYGRDDCRFCAAARAFCEKRKLPFVYHDMTGSGLLMAELCDRMGGEVKSVPQIFIGAHKIGGFEDLQRNYATIQQIIGG